MNCNRCGNILRSGAKFCSSCGLALEIRSGACPFCWQPIVLGKPFCRHCGRPMGVICPMCQRLNRPKVKYCVHCGVPTADKPPTNPYGTGKLLPGSALGENYAIVSKIAQGGMGAVYEVRELTAPDPTRRLALKEMSFAMLKVLGAEKQKLVIDGFRREFELLSKLSHPNLVRAHDYFEAQGRQYYVMEFINGRTLETIMECQPPGQFLPSERVQTWARQLCEVLSYLHDQNPPIIYRDLKPSNIMEISGTQTVKLFDFGIARFYKPGKQSDTLRFGTNGYLAPEVIARRSQTNEQTDVYALGVLLHQLLTRYDPQIDPFRLPPIRSINPSVPETIAAGIKRAISLDPSRRTTTARQVLVDLFG
ncbi:protein kinase [Chloroflexota bacterium]